MRGINAAAVICEYNPFHIGHMYHLQETRRLCGADYIICVMSGDFVQRGEPAAVSKWARAEMALKCGADIVAELPLPYSISSAQYFAEGAVDIICKMSAVSHISFGCESGEELESLIENTARDEHAYIDRSMMKKGASYAAAARSGGISASNDVLGAEYIRALRRRGSEIKVLPVTRNSSVHDGHGSALYIRSLLSGADKPVNADNPDMAEIKKLMPEAAYDILKREMCEGRAPVPPYALEQTVFASLRMLGPEGIRKAAPVSEGLEYRIYTAACEAADYASLIDMCTSLRYTASRVRRSVLAAVLGVTKALVSTPAPYIRILGMKKSSGALMDVLRSRSLVPVVTSNAKFIRSIESGMIKDGSEAREFIDIQRRAADVYALCFPAKDKRAAHSDMTHPLIYV